MNRFRLLPSRHSATAHVPVGSSGLGLGVTPPRRGESSTGLLALRGSFDAVLRADVGNGTSSASPSSVSVSDGAPTSLVAGVCTSSAVDVEARLRLERDDGGCGNELAEGRRGVS